MSDALGQAGLAISGMLFASFWEGAIIVVVVSLFLRAFPRLGASTRYAIWLTTLIMLVAAPVFTIAFSGQHSSVASTTINAPGSAESRSVASATPVTSPQSTEKRESSVATVAPVLQTQRIDIPLGFSLAIAALWLTLGAIRLAVLWTHLRELAILRRGAEQLRNAFGYPVLASECASVPLAIGFMRPAVVLPSSLIEETSAQALDAIVMHEVAHLGRYDVWTNALARVLEALLALNPLAWFVLARLSVEREIACDDWVVARLDAGEVFANALAKLACRPAAFRSIAAPSAIGSRHSVVTRIERLLDRRPRRLRLSAVAVGSVLIVLTLFATVVPNFSPVLAFSPHASIPPFPRCDHPALVEGTNLNLQPTGRWAPITFGNQDRKDPKNTVVDVTIDARGHLTQTTVLSSPHERDAMAARRFLAMMHYRPAVVNCKAVASTNHLAFYISLAPPATISVVRAEYPFGWSSGHPESCRVPDLVHSGIPDVPLVTTKPVTASALVRVDGSGKVVNATLTHASGNAKYDNALLSAARSDTYPLDESTGFKPVRPSGASLSWNATHGYSAYSKCTPRPREYTWTTTFPAKGD